jgi:hypothetical protein
MATLTTRNFIGVKSFAETRGISPVPHCSKQCIAIRRIATPLRSKPLSSCIDAAGRERFRTPPSREKWIADNSFDQVSPRRKVCIKSPFDIVAIRGPRFRRRYLSRRINGRTDITCITWSVAAA